MLVDAWLGACAVAWTLTFGTVIAASRLRARDGIKSYVPFDE